MNYFKFCVIPSSNPTIEKDFVWASCNNIHDIPAVAADNEVERMEKLATSFAFIYIKMQH